MKKLLLALLLAAGASGAAAQSGGVTPGGVSVSGTVGGPLPPQARVGGFVIDAASGAPQGELVSVPVVGGRFSLEVPGVTPPPGALSTLRPDSLFWPGVLEPVSVSGQASTAELRFFVYGDANGNGRRDDTEPLTEAVPFVGRSLLVVSYATAPVQVNAARGFAASLKPGWNALVIEVGRAVRVSVGSRVTNVALGVQR